MRFFRWLFDIGPKILPMDFCEGKSNEELLEALNGFISVYSGNRIVHEILRRLCENERKNR